MEEDRPLVAQAAALSPDCLAALRAGYRAEALLALGERFLTAPCPAAAPWASFVMGGLYPSTAISPLQRELILTALLAARQQPGTMAVHMYWAMMEGADPGAIAHVVLLTGTYTGIDCYTIGIRTLSRLGPLLQQLVDEGQTDTVSVMQAIVQLFPA